MITFINPTKTINTNESDLKAYLAKYSFAGNGDIFEQSKHLFANNSCPNIEEFWQQFVVPLTNRMESNSSRSGVRFRDGLDPLLEYICSANYSLFVHLVSASDASADWNPLSLDTVFTRLASACDVFEALSIKFHILISECSGVPSKVVEGMSIDEFVEAAKEFWHDKYPTLKKYYVDIGSKVPQLFIPTGESILKEFFAKAPSRKEYIRTAQLIRSFRNAIVHDVRVGTLKGDANWPLAPKPEKVSDYRQWSQVERVAGNSDLIGKDFCDVRELCNEYITRLTNAINNLYEYIVKRFKEEFYSSERSALRDVFGIHFSFDGAALWAVGGAFTEMEESSSFQTQIPPITPVTVTPTTNISGVYEIRPGNAFDK